MANGFKIEDNVLLGCSKSAVKVTIPNGVERLDYRAFKGCKLLETIEIPATVSKLDIDFSRDCDALTSVKISEGVKEIWSSIFAGCKKLTSLEYMGTMAQFNAIKGASKVWIENTLPEITCSDGIIPRPIFIIDEGNLYFCDKTRIAANLEIPSGIIKIGKSAFEGIETLKSVKICTGLKEIGYNAFSKCTSLETVEFSDGVEIIGICAFMGCTALRSIVLPATLKLIGAGASPFQNCNSLTTVHYAGSLEQWEKDTNLSYSDILSLLSKKIVALELVPYHSKIFKFSKYPELPSVKKMLSFLNEVIIPGTKEGKYTLIILRKGKDLQKKNLIPKQANDNFIVYEGAECQSASLWINQKARKAILKRL